MDSQSKRDPRHIACARCRERKVKCDGAKPGCGRCIKSGASCQYTRSKKKGNSKMEWKQHLRTINFQHERTTTTQELHSRSPQTTHTSPRASDATPTQSRLLRDSSLPTKTVPPTDNLSVAFYNTPSTIQTSQDTCSTIIPTHVSPLYPFSLPILNNSIDIYSSPQTPIVPISSDDRLLWKNCAAYGFDLVSGVVDQERYINL